MSKNISPSISAQSFSCPHCGALAHQYWSTLFAKDAEKNSVQFWDSSNFEKFCKNIEQQDQEFPEKVLKNIERRSQGEVFISSESRDPYTNELYNVFISRCHSCTKVSLWIYDRLIFPPEPEAEEANPDMPTAIKKDYDEARLVFKHSTKASAALLRLCIEKLCDHLEAKGLNLNEKIGFLVQQGLNEKVQMMLDSVRVIGNDAVHPGQINLDDNKDIARALFKLVNQIVLELISETKEIEEIYKFLPESKKKGILERDKK
jgi:hypothetical protein